MKLSDLTLEGRAELESSVESVLTGLGIADDYKAASALYRAVLRDITRRNSKAPTVDGREKLYAISELVIWDVSAGLDHAVEEARAEDTEQMYGLPSILDHIATLLANYFGEEGRELPEPITNAALGARLASLRGQLAVNDGKCTFRIKFERDEINYLITATVEKVVEDA
jgi:hypothetical protein